jgi:hypothetical protein
MNEHACTSCGNVPNKRLKCLQCEDAGYCNKECQAAHWTTHKEVCNLHRAVTRAAGLVRHLFLEVRELNFGMNVSRIRKRHDEVQFQCDNQPLGLLRRFSSTVSLTEKEKLMVLCSSVCVHAMAYSYDFLDRMLKGRILML